MSTQRVIKKYPNRRLYDTERSRYITLSDVLDLVKAGEDFTVVDANSGDDITRSVLLLIIMEQESSGEPLFTTDILSRMIRFYGESAQTVFTEYLGKSMALFADQQTRLQEQMREMLSKNPVDTMSDMAHRNLQIWQEMQESFFRAAGLRGGSKSKSPPDDD